MTDRGCRLAQNPSYPTGEAASFEDGFIDRSGRHGVARSHQPIPRSLPQRVVCDSVTGIDDRRSLDLGSVTGVHVLKRELPTVHSTESLALQHDNTEPV